MKNLALLLIVGVLFSCNDSEQKASSAPESMVLAGNTLQSEAFNQSFKKMLYTYYNLKDKFITEDVPAIDTISHQLLKAIDSLLIKELKGDTLLISTTKSSIEGIVTEINGLLGEKDIEAKRKSLQMVSEQLYDLIKTIRYDQEVVFHEYCPMAFNNDGATWLSNTAIINNPYIPKKMLNCGEVSDSIDFRRK